MGANGNRLSFDARGLDAVPLLTREQEVELARRVERGDLQAKERMILANLRLVASIGSGTCSAPR